MEDLEVAVTGDVTLCMSGAIEMPVQLAMQHFYRDWHAQQYIHGVYYNEYIRKNFLNALVLLNKVLMKIRSLRWQDDQQNFALVCMPDYSIASGSRSNNCSQKIGRF